VRIEDIDGARSRPELADQFRADLAWLGLSWREVAPQSRRIASYLAAAQVLRGEGLLYPCRCTRAQRRGRTGWGLMVRSIRAPAVHLFRIAARLRRPRRGLAA
jgi:glutamyl/glutaminyl-tRNA synthetase